VPPPAPAFELKVHPHMLRHPCGYALANKGHDKVEDDHVELHLGGGAEPDGTAVGCFDRKAVKLEPSTDEPPDLRFIVDDQYGVG
jgi:hypothetical protein